MIDSSSKAEWTVASSLMMEFLTMEFSTVAPAAIVAFGPITEFFTMDLGDMNTGGITTTP
jgi:hypothetical protein